MNNKEAKQAIEEYAKMQEAQYGCPRCGREMKEKLHTNAVKLLNDAIEIKTGQRVGE